MDTSERALRNVRKLKAKLADVDELVTMYESLQGRERVLEQSALQERVAKEAALAQVTASRGSSQRMEELQAALDAQKAARVAIEHKLTAAEHKATAAERKASAAEQKAAAAASRGSNQRMEELQAALDAQKAARVAIEHKLAAAEHNASAAEQRASAAEQKAAAAEQRAVAAEQRAVTAERSALATEGTVGAAEQRATAAEHEAEAARQRAAVAEQEVVTLSEQQQQQARNVVAPPQTRRSGRQQPLSKPVPCTQCETLEQRAREAEQHAQEGERRAKDEEQRAKEAEQRAREAEQCAKEAEQHAQEAERRAKHEEQRAKEAEQRAREAVAAAADAKALLAQATKAPALVDAAVQVTLQGAAESAPVAVPGRSNLGVDARAAVLAGAAYVGGGVNTINAAGIDALDGGWHGTGCSAAGPVAVDGGGGGGGGGSMRGLKRAGAPAQGASSPEGACSRPTVSSGPPAKRACTDASDAGGATSSLATSRSDAPPPPVSCLSSGECATHESDDDAFEDCSVSAPLERAHSGAAGATAHRDGSLRVAGGGGGAASGGGGAASGGGGAASGGGATASGGGGAASGGASGRQGLYAAAVAGLQTGALRAVPRAAGTAAAGASLGGPQPAGVLPAGAAQIARAGSVSEVMQFLEGEMVRWAYSPCVLRHTTLRHPPLGVTIELPGCVAMALELLRDLLCERGDGFLEEWLCRVAVRIVGTGRAQPLSPYALQRAVLQCHLFGRCCRARAEEKRLRMLCFDLARYRRALEPVLVAALCCSWPAALYALHWEPHAEDDSAGPTPTATANDATPGAMVGTPLARPLARAGGPLMAVLALRIRGLLKAPECTGIQRSLLERAAWLLGQQGGNGWSALMWSPSGGGGGGGGAAHSPGAIHSPDAAPGAPLLSARCNDGDDYDDRLVIQCIRGALPTQDAPEADEGAAHPLYSPAAMPPPPSDRRRSMAAQPSTASSPPSGGVSGGGWPATCRASGGDGGDARGATQQRARGSTTQATLQRASAAQEAVANAVTSPHARHVTARRVVVPPPSAPECCAALELIACFRGWPWCLERLISAQLMPHLKVGGGRSALLRLLGRLGALAPSADEDGARWLRAQLCEFASAERFGKAEQTAAVTALLELMPSRITCASPTGDLATVRATGEWRTRHSAVWRSVPPALRDRYHEAARQVDAIELAMTDGNHAP